jgi:hypothetical protein
MTYDEIAEGYDKIADALTLQMEAVKGRDAKLGHEAAVVILELREKAASARGQARYDARNAEEDERERVRRAKYLELEERTVAARERQALALDRQADSYAALVIVMERLTAKPT